MRKKNDKLFDSEIQKVLNKLISEEQIAYDFYVGCTVATDSDEVRFFQKMFIDTANDELNDHCRKLVAWAVDNDYDVPFKYRDYEKFADRKTFSCLNSLKSGEKAKYYIDKAIEQEKAAVENYTESIKLVQHAPYSLYEIMMQNYLDEKEHLAHLQLLKDAVHDGIELMGF